MWSNMKGWRTLAVNGALAALAAVQASGLAAVVPPPYMPFVVIGVNALNMWLRTQTDTPVGVK